MAGINLANSFCVNFDINQGEENEKNIIVNRNFFKYGCLR